ncbi:MAG: cytochrome-c peroxidase [Neisseriaceae bacterium]|nr:cytochrome-c peroxidase [Neisseriaceae bacterium]
MSKSIKTIVCAVFGATVAMSSAAFADSKADQELLQSAQAIFKPLPTFEEMQKVKKVTDAQIKLGQALFNDPRLSADQVQSCNTCHNLATYGVDNQSFSKGVTGGFGGRNAPSVLNSSLFIAQFWDGRAKDVEEQAGGPMLNPAEMAMPDEASVEKVLRSIPDYKPMFDAAFGKSANNVNFKNATAAIGAFERTLLTPTRFDKYLRGDINALTQAERAGLKTFIDVGCVACHTGVGMGGDQYQKFGLVDGPYWKFTGSKKPDEGRFEVTKSESDMNVFRVPGLRNVARTYPYFHDGSVWSLEQAVDIMGQAQLGQKMSSKDVKSIVTFLNALTGEVSEKARTVPTLPAAGPNTPHKNHHM